GRLGRLLVEMEGLGVELAGESLDLLRVESVRGTAEALPDCEILEIEAHDPLASFSAMKAWRRLVRSSAAGPGAERNSGEAIGRPLLRSTRIGSAGFPVRLSTSRTLGPSGAKCRLPQASSDHSTGRKSRPRSVSRYSSRGGCSL